MRQQMEEEQWDLCRLLDAALHGRPAEMLPPAEKYGAILELAAAVRRAGTQAARGG